MERYPNINILLNLPQPYIPKAEFVFRTYCYILRLNPKFIYGTRFEAAHLYYGPPPDRDYSIRVHFDPNTADFFEKQELYPLEQVNFCKFRENHIPFLFSKGGDIFSFTTDSCIFRKDIVASGFYFLTCWHEYIFSQRGVPRGRVDYKESLQYRWDFTETPVVDIYCQMLLFAMEKVVPEFVRDIAWQQDKKFAVSLSHDIDYWDFWDLETQRKTQQYNLHSFFSRPLNATYKFLGHALHKKFCYDHFRLLNKILHKEQDLGVRSTWFLLAGVDFQDQRQNYIAELKPKEEIIDLLGQEDVGLHGSPDSAYDPQILGMELDRLRDLGFDPNGFRTHYLHFDYQKSFAILEAAGIKYDSTLGYWESIGFRAGTSFPFFPFNIAENRPFRVLEIPLIVMDTSLYSAKAMNMSYFAASRSLTRLIKVAASYQSHLSLLWHNTSFDPIDYPFWGRLYWKTISKALKEDGWVTSLKDIYEEWVNLSY
jgi:hypothetical protein